MTGTVVIEKRDADGVWRELEQPHPYRARITHAPSGRDLSDAVMRMWPRADMWRAHNTPFVMVVHSDTATSIRCELAREQERARIAAPLPTKHPLPVGTLVWVTDRTVGGFAATVFGQHSDGIYRLNPTESWRGQTFAAESAVAVFDPHWNEKRAYRQGKTIQCRSPLACAEWVDCPQTMAGVPKWAPHCEYRVKPGTPPPAAKPKAPRSEEPWHARFDRALKAGVNVQFRESEDHAWQSSCGTCLSYCYGEGNYRIGGELDPYAHLKAAALNGLQIQRRTSRGFWIDRVPARVFKHWTYPPSHYRVKPQEA